MNFYAALNDDGFPIAFYNLSINDNIPSDAVEITDAQWREFIDNPGLRRWDGKSVIVYAPPPAPAPMLIASPWQIRKALNHFGIRDQIEAHIASADQDTKDAWEWATEFREDDPHVAAAVVALAPEINMTETDAEAFKHQIFALAVTL